MSDGLERKAAAMKRVGTVGLACVAVAVAACLGCGKDKQVDPISPPVYPPREYLNNSPSGTVARLMLAYQYMDAAEYDTLLTADFHYRFSEQTDPVLVAQYGFGWSKTDESQSARHLFHGFTNEQGVVMPAASAIVATLNGVAVGTDTAHVDSAAWYQAVNVPNVVITMVVPGPDGAMEYDIASPLVFLVVRGDAAVLNAGQPHVADRWYVRRIDDLTPLLAQRKGNSTATPSSLRPTTWGLVRAAYR